MRSVKSYIVISLASLLSVTFAKAQKIPWGNKMQGHPRLLLFKGEEEMIREKINSDQFLASIHKTIIRKSDEFLAEPPLEYILIGGHLLKTSRLALTYIYYLSYSWRMTGDNRYAERAKQEMLNVCGFKNWGPGHFLDVAEMTTAVSIGYDWLYGYLDPKTRSTIENAILKKGLYESMPGMATDKSHYSWLKKKNNWNAVCNTSMALGSLAIYDLKPQLAQTIVERSVRLVRDVAMQEYLPNGNYPEGYTYWSYGTTYNLILIDALEKIFGSSFGMTDNKGFMSTPEYILQMSTQNMGCFAYSDCFTGFTFSFPMFWFANRTQTSSMLWGEADKLAYMKKNGVTDDEMFNARYLPSVLLWASPKPFGELKQPEKRLYVGQGTTPVAILRNHWGGDDEIFVGLKGGTCETNHSHMDIGSFVMYKGVNQWVTDLGAQDYNSLTKFGLNLSDRSQTSSRWDALRLSTKLHNVVTFNGAKQDVAGKAYIDATGNADNFIYATTNLSSINKSQVAKHLRGVSIVDNKYVMIRDEITNSKKFTDTRWAVLTPASVKIIDDHNAELSMNGEKMLMKVEGEGVKMQTWSTKSEYSFDMENGATTMVGFTMVMQPGQSTAFTVLLIPENVQVRKGHSSPVSQWKY
ncbi:MAG: heparinase II/III domain-containing protein [Chitinophagaceae bacterium]